MGAPRCRREAIEVSTRWDLSREQNILCPVRDLNFRGVDRIARWDRWIRMGAPPGRAPIETGPPPFAPP